MDVASANSFTPALAEMLGDSRWFPESLDERTRSLSLVKTERERIASQVFLSQSVWADESLPKRSANLQAVADTLASISKKPTVHFIWHTAYCCSTLLSRTLDMPGRSLSLREPDALSVLARMKRSNAFGAEGVRRHVQSLLWLYGRPFQECERVVLKPGNLANNLISEAAQAASGKMLFLYSDCRSFLLSVAQWGETRRAHVRQLFFEFLNDGHEQRHWSVRGLIELSDLQIAALVWHMQILEFRRSMVALGSRAASLNCEVFLEAPAATLAALDNFFGLDLGAAHIGEVIAGPLLRHHAKAVEVPFDKKDRREKHKAPSGSLADDVAEVVAWSYEVCKATPQHRPVLDAALPVSGGLAA